MSDAPSIALASTFRGLIGVARRQITPPVGIYARNWGVAKHDVAEGVHRPLTLTCITFATIDGDGRPLVLASADLMSWRSREDEWDVRGAALEALGLDESRLMLCLSHTHSAGSVRSDDAGKPGGSLIAAYRAAVRDALLSAARDALAAQQEAILTWRYGKCDLAADRDLPEPGGERIACGYNPAAPADETLLVGRVTDPAGRMIATMVNYACHPTTLAWENRLLSPDYVGGMREVVETHTGAPCLFLQGASGELAPAEQYSDDTTLADRHGRRLGFAVLSTLEAMERPGERLAYQGIVESGAPLAIWRQEAIPASGALDGDRINVELPLKPLAPLAEIEAAWRDCSDPVMKERLWRQRAVRKVVGDGAVAAMPLWIWRIGDALLVGQPNEAYSQFQRELRAAFSPRAVAVMNLVNGSAGYLPPRRLYDRDIYQVWQSPFAAGGLELLIERSQRAARQFLGDSS